MRVQYFGFEKFHNKKGVGSTNLRVHNLIKYWPEASLYQYGDNPDVLIFQKVYSNYDYGFPNHFPGLKILDICDADWLDWMLIKKTLDGMDGVTVPTQPLKEFLSQMTDKPIAVIPDRHDLAQLPPLKTHTGPLTRLVWFGYHHNAETIREAIWSIEDKPYTLTIISDSDPTVWRYARGPEFKDKCRYLKYHQSSIIQDLRQFDAVLFPNLSTPRPVDRFKSNNKTTLAMLAGLPVIKTADDLEKLNDPKVRQSLAQTNYDNVKRDYDCKLSVEDMKTFINQLKR